MHSLKTLILKASKELEAAGIENPVREAYLLMGFSLNREMAFLRGHPEYIPTDSESSHFKRFVERRSGREPFQHIVGKQEFYGLDFEVTPDVLVPRPETELLVETVLGFYEPGTSISICEIGVGSGCISVSLLKNLPLASVVAVDTSSAAIDVAQRNAVKHGVDDRISLIVSDVFTALSPENAFDLIVSNPPYIPLSDIPGLQAEVKNFDPLAALTDFDDGLSITQRICEAAPSHLKSGGRLLLEIGAGQSDEVLSMFGEEFWASSAVLNDLRSIPRIIVAKVTVKNVY